MKIKHTLHLDLASTGLPLRIQATQDDSISHVLQLHLKENGKPWPIPADAQALVHFRKSDRTGGVYDTLPDRTAAWQASGNVLRITLVPQVLTAPGETALAVTLVQGSCRLTVATVVLQVRPCPGFAGVSESYSYVSAFLPQPTTAAPGQLLRVKEVDALGTVLSTEAVSGGLSGSAGNLLLSLLQKCLYTEDMSLTLASLEQQINGTAPEVILVSIQAVYTGGAVYAGSDVAALQGIAVTAHYSDGTRQQVKNFSLSGVIGLGENTVTVHFGGCTDTVTVVGTARPVDQYFVYNNLSSVTNSNPATTVTPGSSYSCILTPNSGYELKRVLVTMDGETVFEENYTTAPLQSGWSTDCVTGDIIITAFAQLPLALQGISVTYSGGPVAAGTKLSALTGISVTAHYSDGSSAAITGGYGLTGTIGSGTNVITVSYSGYTATFTVTGTADPAAVTLKHSWDLTKSLTDSVGGVTAVTTAIRNENGLVFDASDIYCDFGAVYGLNRTYEMDIASHTFFMPEGMATIYGRLFIVDTDTNTAQGGSGFIYCYRPNDGRVGWQFYSADKGGWNGKISDQLEGTSENDYAAEIFNGKTLSLYVDESSHVTLYLDGVQIGKTAYAFKDYPDGHVYIGHEGVSNVDIMQKLTVTGLRVYEGRKV